MEDTLREIEKIVPMKDDTRPGDIVIVVMENPMMVAYALVRNIVRDTSKRDEWWHVELVFLTLPPQPVTWILRTEQFTGREVFTMGGDRRFIRAVDVAAVGGGPDDDDDGNDGDDGQGPVLRVVK